MTDSSWVAVAVQVLFGTVYVATLALAVAGGRRLQHWMVRPPTPPDGSQDLDEYDYAYLAGGLDRVVYAGLTRLYLQGAVFARSEGYEVIPREEPLPEGAHVVEHHLFAALGRGRRRFDAIRVDVMVALHRYAEARLGPRGILIGRRRAAAAAWAFGLLAALPIAASSGLFGYNHYRLGDGATNDPVTIVAWFVFGFTLIGCLGALSLFSADAASRSNTGGEWLVKEELRRYREGLGRLRRLAPAGAVFEKREWICEQPVPALDDATLGVALLGMEECAGPHGLSKLFVSLHQPEE